MPAPGVTPWFRSTISNQFLELDQRASLLLPEADVLWWELAYTLDPHVPGLIFNPETRQIGGMPSEAGSYEMVYRASTTAGGFAELQFTIDVGEVSIPESSEVGLDEDSMDDSMADDDFIMGDDSEMNEEEEEAADESADESEEEDDSSQSEDSSSEGETPRASLSAGEVNDNERWEEYLQYRDEYSWLDVHDVDISERYVHHR